MDDGKNEQKDEHDHVRAGPAPSYTYNQWTADDELEPPQDTEWEKPPVYELVGSTPNVTTRVTAQGDVQPFLALGSQLRAAGHRARIATHDVFRDFVMSTGLEFFPISVQKSCIEPDPETNIPFVAEVIIANPPSFAHVHCAQALGVPLHLMFTMPWSPTKAFPHPLANIERSDADLRTTNYLSYGLVELMTWQGYKQLSLDPVPMTMGPALPETLGVSFTYCCFKKDVYGFFFREEPSYTPDEELDHFLSNGPPPVYIGFGSIVMDDAEKMTAILLAAVRACGVRAIISRGWSKLRAGQHDPNVLLLGDCPHGMHVSCVVHHGGAGTTACGLLNGRPTVIVPFFGDQAFWGQMVAAARVGPQSIHHKMLNENNITQAIQYCLTPEASKIPIKLSDKAAFILTEHKKIDPKHLKLYKPKPITINNLRWDPVTAASSVLLGTMFNFTVGFSEVFTGPAKAFRSKENGGDGGGLPKATLVDFPLALTEGLHHMPRLYGEEVRNYGEVKDWKSGGVVAGKTLGYGFMDGLSGTTTKPYKGAKEGGWAGFGKGLGKGGAGLVTGPGAGMFGLFAYPLQGMYKSMIPSTLSPAQRKILLARQVYGLYMERQRGYAMQDKGEKDDDGNTSIVLGGFERLNSELNQK
ncbi:glycosyltransferase family 1 protein [Rhexocercosporidium sp. MPI-PUGE-AT-0058]|nr:glycosyltransferase family 1 protein [Rhexocercosporidium sp. MPI-PUGE-AT-0058]